MKKHLPILFTLLLLIAFQTATQAQCAMCAGQVESATDAGASVALGVNKGVLYIFMMPYIIIATIGYFWWRAKKRAQA